MFSMDFNKNMFGNHNNKLKDKTKQFLKMVENLEHIPSIILLNIGGRGSGKTANTFKFIKLFNENLTDLGVAFYNAPADFIEKLKINMPAEQFAKVHNCQSIREITHFRKMHNQLVLVVDEGQRDLNAKKALTKTSRRFESMIAISRQQEIFLIYNTQIENVYRTLRLMTDLIFYKGNTSDSIVESDDRFAKDHSLFIQNLFQDDKMKRSAFRSNYRKFTDENGKLIKNGYIDLELFDLVPWWTDSISKAYENTELDADYEKFEKIDLKVLEVVDMFEKAFPNAYKMKNIKESMIRGWLKRENKELCYDLEDSIRDVIDELNYRRFLEEIKKDDDKDKKEKQQQKQMSESNNKDNINIKFSEFCKNHVENENKEIIELYLEGTPQKEIAFKIEKGNEYVNQRIQTFRNSEQGYLFEQFFRMNFFKQIKLRYPKFDFDETKFKTAGNDNDPDFIDPLFSAIFTLKCYADRSKSKTLYQSQDFHPEFERAKKEHKKYFAILKNILWSDNYTIYRMDPAGDDKLLYSKSDPSVNFEELFNIVEKIECENESIETYINQFK